MSRTLATIAVLATLLFGSAPAHAQAAAPGSPADDFVPPTAVEPLGEPAATGLAAISSEALATHVGFLAAPSQEGRGLGSRGLDSATAYVAAVLALSGIAPAGDPVSGRPGYAQTVPLREIRTTAGTVEVTRLSARTVRAATFVNGVDCALPQVPPSRLTAPVVFAGFGIREPALGRDDWRGLDVAGSIVMVLGGLPPGAEWRTPELADRYDYNPENPRRRYAARLDAARAAGAAALLVVEAEAVLAAQWQAIETRRGDDEAAETYFLPFEPPPTRDPLLVRVSPAVARAAFGDDVADLSKAGGARLLPGVTATIAAAGTERLVRSKNLIAVIPGCDLTLKDRAVVIGAHIDHLGRRGTTVFPGADDNASGVAAVLEIAKALNGLPERPKRTVVVAFWTGEEEGKLGSGHWMRHPLWPVERTDVYVNLDMIGHPWSTEEIATLLKDTRHPDAAGFLASLKPSDFVEPGLPTDTPELAAALQRAARATGLAIHLDRTDGTSGGSDYRDFARAHVPWIRFFGNFFPAYHEPGDTPESLDPDQVRRVARLAFATTWLLANR
jgi:hypothetical protein